MWDACCRVPQRGSLCAEKDAFLRRRAIVERMYCHTWARMVSRDWGPSRACQCHFCEEGDLGQSKGKKKKSATRVGGPATRVFKRALSPLGRGRITKKAASKQRHGYRKRGGCEKRGLGNFEDSRLEIQRERKSESEKCFIILMVPSSRVGARSPLVPNCLLLL